MINRKAFVLFDEAGLEANTETDEVNGTDYNSAYIIVTLDNLGGSQSVQLNLQVGDVDGTWHELASVTAALAADATTEHYVGASTLLETNWSMTSQNLIPLPKKWRFELDLNNTANADVRILVIPVSA
jgi:hypothetical protein